MQYQWYFRPFGSQTTITLDNENEFDLFIAVTTLDWYGYFSVLAWNRAGEILSEEALVDFYDPIHIITQPESIIVHRGASMTLSVDFNGTVPIGIVWYHNGEILEGQEENTYFKDDIDVEDGGVYQVRLRNLVSTIFTDAVNVTVFTPPEILEQPYFDQILAEGFPFELFINVTGFPRPTFRW